MFILCIFAKWASKDWKTDNDFRKILNTNILTLDNVSETVLLLPGVEAGSDKEVSMEPSDVELGKLLAQSNVTSCRQVL